MIYPLLWLLMSSFKSNETMFHDAYSLIPEVWDIAANYGSGFEGVGGVSFLTFLGNTVFVTLVGMQKFVSKQSWRRQSRLDAGFSV